MILEKEFEQYKALRKYCILKARIMQYYKDLEEGQINLPDFMRETPQTAIFRYSKDYECNISTDTELPIDECIEQYKKYIIWKKEKGIKGYE